MMSDVPPSIVLACARRKPRAMPRCSSPAAGSNVCERAVVVESRALPRDAVAPSRSTASFCSRWLYFACCSLVIDPSGPASAPLSPLVGGALVVEPDEPTVDVRLREPLPDTQIGDRTVPLDEPGDRAAADRVAADRTRARQRDPLVHQRGDRDPPSVALGTERSESGTRASVKKTSLNSASPVICTSGRTSTPGACMSTTK